MWQEIARKQRGDAWPDSPLIDSFRKRVEAGTHRMATMYEGNTVKLMVKPGREVEPWPYWSEPATQAEYLAAMRKG